VVAEEEEVVVVVVAEAVAPALVAAEVEEGAVVPRTL